VFFPQEALNRWMAVGEVELSMGLLTIRRERRKYRLLEAARVLDEVSGLPDPHEITGKVKTVAYLNELGASLIGDSMVIADNAYQVVPGFVGSPVGSFAEHRAEHSFPLVPLRRPDVPTPGSDEELLASFLVRNL
jgi:hypothetical protein